jgi:hypothetical protein
MNTSRQRERILVDQVAQSPATWGNTNSQAASTPISRKAEICDEQPTPMKEETPLPGPPEKVSNGVQPPVFPCADDEDEHDFLPQGTVSDTVLRILEFLSVTASVLRYIFFIMITLGLLSLL